MFRLSFRFYLFVALSALAAVPVGLLGTYHAYRLRQTSDAAVDQQLRYASVQLSRELGDMLGSIVRSVQTTSRLVEARRSLGQPELEPIVEDQLARWRELISVMVCDLSGTVIAGAPPRKSDGTPFAGSDYSDRGYYREVMRTHEGVISDIIASKLTGLPAIVVAEPVRNPSGRMIAYSAASFEFKRFNEPADRLRRSLRDAVVAVYDDRGHLLLHTGESDPQRRRAALRLPLLAPTHAEVEVRAAQDLDGNDVLAAASSMQRNGLHWNILVFRRVSSIRDEANRSARSTLLFSAVASLIALLVAGLLATFLARPVQLLVHRAVVLGRGDFSTETGKLPRFMPREVWHLVRAFELMVAQLRELLLSLSETQAQMGVAFDELASVSAEQRESVKSQNFALEALEKSAFEIRIRGSAAAARAQEVLGASNHADGLGRQGQQALEVSFKALEDLRQQSVNAQTSLGELLERTDELEAITSTVKDLAERSNVVALNAAIQASKADARGKVFGIVSSEMRLLANESAKETENIRAVLRELSVTIRARVNFGRESSQRTDNSLAHLQTSSERTRELTDLLAETTAAARGIASEVQQQANVIAEVSVALETLRTSMQNTEASSRRAHETALTLKDSSEGLEKLVRRFRL